MYIGVLQQNDGATMGLVWHDEKNQFSTIFMGQLR
jgi:hypothetical protein